MAPRFAQTRYAPLDQQRKLMFTWERIEAEWLMGGVVDMTPQDIVVGFNEVERVFGVEWLDLHAQPTGAVVRGPVPTLTIARLGNQLLSLANASNSNELVRKLRTGDLSAFAELSAIDAVSRGEQDLELDIAPQVTVKGQTKVPDFRIRKGHDTMWTYVEVTRPETSALQQKAVNTLHRIAAAALVVERTFTLEVILSRDPSEPEIEGIMQDAVRLASLDGMQEHMLPQLGRIRLNYQTPGLVVTEPFPELQGRPAVGAATSIAGGDKPSRHVVVRLAFSDERADAFLRSESRQLSLDTPGIIMVASTNTIGALTVWPSLLQRRLQPHLHTRVGAICIFETPMLPTDKGLRPVLDLRTVLNEYARFALPDWMRARLRQLEETGRQAVQRASSATKSNDRLTTSAPPLAG